MHLYPQLGEGKKENQREGTNCPHQVPLNNPGLLPQMVPQVPFPRSVQLNITYAKDCDGATSQENQEIRLVLEELLV